VAALRILHLIPNLGKGGAQRLAIDICRELGKREDVEVMLATLSPENEYGHLTNGLGWITSPAHVRPSISGRSSIDVTQFTGVLDTFRPNIVHSHLYPAELVAKEVQPHGCLQVTHMHSNIPQLRNLSFTTLFSKSRFTDYFEKRRLLRRWDPKTARVIAISNDTLHFLEKTLPGRFHRGIVFLLNAIDINRFKRPPGRFGNRLQLVTVGNLLLNKNQIFLVDVVKRLGEMGHEVELMIAGDGPLRDAIINRAETLNVRDRIKLLGKVDHVQCLLWGSGIMVHSATYESLGLVLLEGMTAGLPVVTLDGKGNRDVMRHGENGFLIERNDPALFASKVAELIRDDTLYNRMSSFAVEFASRFDIVPYVDGLLEVYHDGLNELAR